jgi:heme-degrading monooxygenase HmoA
MFQPITVPYGAKMLFNTLKLNPGVNSEEVEFAIGEMCNVVKATYGGDKGGFLGGQVFRFTGFVSDEGSMSESRSGEAHVAIVTYWRSFEEHERSHADSVFRAKFAALARLCSDSKELGYEMLWQGAPEEESAQGALPKA